MLQLTKPLMLASNSPRRQQLLRDAGFEFTVKVKDTNEDFPATMPPTEVPAFLALKKAEAFRQELDNQIILTADTIVVVDNEILNKPQDATEARLMLKKLSGRQHQVITGVCVMTKESTQNFIDVANVFFRELTNQEIEYYIKTCKPFDKAGAYGVQDFIGMVGIPRMEGSYFTVMGLPVHRVYDALKPFFVID
ncbi:MULTISPECIES: Maf family nucleotide pyrophosphatase [unclassified Arcicella]|uniref:Maf family protein n=1 Tax=unclassified Arcicella TaxID=2644986 RepID=UPI002861F1CD|nr:MULTISPECIES: Maf family nucleotide pyrophosphatase [unclassified Arcicella]MDR6563148.1 septum formation protein [Arcicella sp. BE51]MDR6811701.1 septum formation protein [Arcicella sp. BE140]MDR6823226.1 septum formation protein [Arcicella sp. BE139]